ncbi:hypothetical protein GS537_07760 [Saccharibacter sp. EH60]|nr:hypothetical protein [Saccharibacter sp. EH60]
MKNLLTMRAPDLSLLNMSWFGGEPLLTKDILIDVLSHVQKLREEYGFRLISSATTNGYFLDEETFLVLGDLGVTDYQISFDGVREFHNVMRFINHPDRSFDKIWANVLLFNQLRKEGRLTNGKILLRLHLHAENHASLLELSALIKKHLEPAFFSVLLKNIAHLGGEQDHTFETVDHTSQTSAQRHRELTHILQDFQPTDPNDEGAGYVCYATMLNSFAIRSDGRLAKCTVALNSAKNQIGRLTKEGHFSFEEGKVTPWIRALQTLDKQTVACPLSFVEHYAA